MTIDFSTLFMFMQTGKRGSFCAQCMSGETAESCLDLLRRLFHGLENPRTPVPFSWAEGSRIYDVLLSTLPSYLVSDRVLDVLQTVGATGWSRFPIELSGKTGELIPGYSGLVVTGGCGRLQNDRSRVETRIGASGKPYKVKIGLFFDESCWDGTDVFTAEGSTFVFMTGRVKDALEAMKISNASFTRLSTLERQW